MDEHRRSVEEQDSNGGARNIRNKLGVMGLKFEQGCWDSPPAFRRQPLG